MRRLYLQIYLAFVGILVLFALLTAGTLILLPESPHERRMMEGIERQLGEILPGPDRPVAELQAALEQLGRRFEADLAVRAPDGGLIAAFGEALPVPGPGRRESGWLRSRGVGPMLAIRLPEGRWLVARHRRDIWGVHGLDALAMLAILFGAIAIGAYPVVRRITRRLERLQTGVEELAAGDLSARVEVKGNDEVAKLGRSFNRAAERIERLVEAQRTMFASASHELRSPLARMRVAVELLAGDARPELRDRVSKDIAELDELIGELLLASQLAAPGEIQRAEEVDLLALVAEEAARSGAGASGEPVQIQGDPRMLRRLVRNLLENARRYGAGSPVEASVVPNGEGGARLSVADRGPGVPERERERIFEPFYRPAGAREGADGGAGLGLALVRRIARHHGGDARCLPREGGGTRFEVELGSG